MFKKITFIGYFSVSLIKLLHDKEIQVDLINALGDECFLQKLKLRKTKITRCRLTLL